MKNHPQHIVLMLIVAIWVLPSLAFGEEDGKNFSASSLPIPRFASLDATEANLRTGPGLRYPIRWVVTREGLPIEIIREFDVWREIRDIDGDEGWVHKSMLSGNRTAIVQNQIRTIFKKPDRGARPVAKLEPGVIVDLDRCEEEWCYVKVAGYRGWLKRSEIWGIYPDEQVEE